VYKTYNNPKFGLCPLFPDTLNVQNGDDFAQWLWEITDELHDNYWLDESKVTYNVGHFLTWFAGEIHIALP